MWMQYVSAARHLRGPGDPLPLRHAELREGGNGRHVGGAPRTRIRLHLSLLREYIDHEFSDVREKLVSFDYDIESIIDDWILLGFLVGNVCSWSWELAGNGSSKNCA